MSFHCDTIEQYEALTKNPCYKSRISSLILKFDMPLGYQINLIDYPKLKNVYILSKNISKCKVIFGPTNATLLHVNDNITSHIEYAEYADPVVILDYS